MHRCCAFVGDVAQGGLIPAGLVSGLAALCTGVTSNDSLGVSLNDTPIVTIDGETTSLASYANKVKLIVNVASRCGLTPQYKKLEELQKIYGDRGFTVLGFPSNQFLQELSSSEAIQEFCSTTYGVTFPMFEKVKVNGRSQHPLYTELTKTADAEGMAGRVKWNFEKFLVTPAGEVHRFRSKVEPDVAEIVDLIEASLPAAG
jgi:glutathione peroxidase